MLQRNRVGERLVWDSFHSFIHSFIPSFIKYSLVSSDRGQCWSRQRYTQFTLAHQTRQNCRVCIASAMWTGFCTTRDYRRRENLQSEHVQCNCPAADATQTRQFCLVCCGGVHWVLGYGSINAAGAVLFSSIWSRRKMLSRLPALIP